MDQVGGLSLLFMRLKERRSKRPTKAEQRIRHAQREAAKWLIGLINDLDWGRKKWVDESSGWSLGPLIAAMWSTGFLKTNPSSIPNAPRKRP